jgi:hypothetical protein
LPMRNFCTFLVALLVAEGRWRTQEARVAVSIGLTGTCNVLGTGSAVASPCVEISLRSQEMNLNQSVISGVAEARVLKESKEMHGQKDGHYVLR